MNQVLMCSPTYFDVKYDINPWMSNNINFVNLEKAKEQWNILYAMIRSCASVQLIEPNKICPDMVFTANAGFQFNYKNVILSNFKYQERRAEENLFHQWFESNGYIVHKVNHHFEGQGDMLTDTNGNIWLGTGFRTDYLVVDEIESILNYNVNTLELVDPRWYHLDTCFCPLPHGELMWYPGAFSEESQEHIRFSFDTTIDICEEDALLFACNSVCLYNNIFTPRCSDVVSIMMEKFGYNHMMFDLSEFMKAGGAAKCLTMDIHELR